MPRKIFINYRRDDDPAAAARVRDGLATRFGRSAVFMDVDNLLAGQRFDQELAKALAACDVLVAIIGTNWLDVMQARAASTDRDYVREEIAAALQRKVLVIPVRVGREGRLAPLPRPEELPEDIRDLVQHQKHDVVHEHYGRDIASLVQAIVEMRRTGSAGLRWLTAGVAATVLAGLGVLAWPYMSNAGLSGALGRLSASVARPPVSAMEAREAINLLNGGQLAVYIDRNWDPNDVVDGDGNAALHWLMEVCEKHRGHDRGKLRDIATQLISAGAKVDQPNKFGDTPARIAASPKFCGPGHPVLEVLTPAAAERLRRPAQPAK